MSRLLLGLPLLVWAMAAQALTCLPQDVARTYHEAAESDDRYLIVLGEVRFDAAHLPETDLTRQGDTPPDTRIPARLTGRALSRGGFLHPFDREIVLNAQCFGPWCAGAVSGARYLAFVNLDRQVPEVTVTPCGGFAFAEPTARMERQVLACLNGGVCAPKMTR